MYDVIRVRLSISGQGTFDMQDKKQACKIKL